jgi:hypothetical protein
MLAKHYIQVSTRQTSAEAIRSVKEMLKADKARLRKFWADRKAAGK